MGHDGTMTDNPTSTPSASEPDDSTRIFTPGPSTPYTGDSPSQNVPPAPSQSTAPTWRSTTSASSAPSSTPAPEPTPGWRGIPPQTPASASSAPAAPSSVASASWGTQPAQQPQPAQQWAAPQGQPVQQQQSWGQNTGQQPGQAPQGAPYAQQQMPYAAAPQASTPAPGQKDGLRALFDFGFTSMVTPLLVKIIYIVVMVLAVLSWLAAIFISVGAASATDIYGRRSSGGGFLIVLSILFGWIPGALDILVTRVLCEFVLASLKTQRAAEEILAHLKSE
ncbi:Protein of unknown function DUF4282 [Propionibacterium ruminifibrarum]|uniref:DUF4282 domain-containing protein n=2 Tax=Propionibacterium ruminifibrarum TaxID=1962131 RepID=A0A375I6X0_9ACTN|nr:Protein of unknown function DUF4282 [Propionibacterium ruminifibrarum]